MITFNEMPSAIEQIQSDLRSVLALLQNSDKKDELTPTLLTRREVTRMLKIDASTLHNWVKAKRLTKLCLGGRVYFQLQDIMDVLKKQNTTHL